MAGATVLVVAVAALFAMDIDPHSLMILATATYFVAWLGSFGVSWYRRPPRDSEGPNHQPGPTGAARR